MFVRVDRPMKKKVAAGAKLLGESESVIVREALRAYFEAKESLPLRGAPPGKK